MRKLTQAFALIGVGSLAIAFVVSFALGLRRPAPADSNMAADLGDAVPGVFSGRRVEVLNAAGKPGLARSATRLLRTAGYDVVYFGNASRSREESSIVIDRVGKPEIARAVAGRLGIRHTDSRPDATRLVEVTVILGPGWPPEKASGRKLR